MSERIDWKNYDYSEGPPRLSALKKTRNQDTNPPISPTTQSYIYSGGSNAIETTPKSTNDLTMYEDELLAKITSQKNGDPKLTYRPSRHTSHPIPSTTSPSYSNPSPSPTLDTKKESTSSKSMVTSSSHVSSPSMPTLLQTTSGSSKGGSVNYPIHSANRPLDGDPSTSDSESIMKDAPIKNTTHDSSTIRMDPPGLSRQQNAARLQVPSLEPNIPTRSDSFSYTSFDHFTDKYHEVDSMPDKDNPRGKGESLYHDEERHQEGKFTNIVPKSNLDVDQDDHEMVMWDQAREEWNQMFQDIQKTYQSGKDRVEHSTSSHNSEHWDEDEQHDFSQSPAASVASSMIIQLNRDTTVSQRATTGIMKQPKSPPIVQTQSNLDSALQKDVEEKEEEGNAHTTLNHIHAANNTKADSTLMNKSRYKEESRQLPMKEHLNTSFDTQITSNSPHFKRSTHHVYDSDSLSLDDEDSSYDKRSYSPSYPERRSHAVSRDNEMTSRPKTASRVGFHSDDRNQIHEYIPEDHEPSVTTYENDEEETYQSEATFSYTEDSFAGRSLNSLYSKSNFSEVEDFFSDILLLGSSDYRNPGKRPLKYKSNHRHAMDHIEEQEYEKERDRLVREQRRAESMLDRSDDEDITTDDGESMTLTTVDDEHTSSPFRKNRNVDDSTNDDVTFDDLDDEEEGTYLDTVDDETDRDDASGHLERYHKRYSGREKYGSHEDDEPSSLSVLWGFFENSVAAINEAFDSAISSSTQTGSKSSKVGVIDEEGKQMRREDFMQIAFDSVFRRKSLTARLSQHKHFDEYDMAVILTEIALSAARARHAVKNLIYDETASLDIMKHIKIYSIMIPLPLGLLFEESTHCCWVSRIFEQGNAALFAEKTNNRVLLGDHIVAVNETSVVNLNVTKLCKVLSVVNDPSFVELTFIRYTGPIRHSSANLEHEGYEVVDPILSGPHEKAIKSQIQAVHERHVPKVPSDKKTKAQNQQTKKNEKNNSNRLFKIFKRR